jgi:hypothetical protein
MRFSSSSGVCEAAVDVSVGAEKVIGSEIADDADEQQAKGNVPHAPKRRDVSGVEQLLRGKIPGTPG